MRIIMTDKSYKNILAVFIIAYLIIFLFDAIGEKADLFTKQTFIFRILFYFEPILSLFLLFFGIYAYRTKIQISRKLYKPITVIALASILTMSSFGPLLWKYFLFSDSRYQTYSLDELQQLKVSCLKLTGTSNLSKAIVYYLETGELAEYLDENGKKTLFTPSEKQRSLFHQRNALRRSFASYTRAVNILMIIAVVSCICFLMFLSKAMQHNPIKGNK